MSKLAVVLFNLGGPDNPEVIQKFLFNLFYDPAILSVPKPLRWLLAVTISWCRTPRSRAMYEKIGGCSPLLRHTEEQAVALQETLSGDEEIRVFIAMRYWHPQSDETVRQVKAFGAEEVVLLPLYPQFSTTTTESSLADWAQAARGLGLTVPTRAICCYPTEPGLIHSHVRLLREGIKQAAATAGSASPPPRVLFSAHGLPKRIVDRGDPYPWQVEQTAAAVVAELDLPALDWVVCYQSRVGPLQWIGPSTEKELERAGREKVPVVITPIAFVSEHSETLVELDMDYAKQAYEFGVPAYVRVPTLGSRRDFIEGLARLVEVARQGDDSLVCGSREVLCPRDVGACCPHRATVDLSVSSSIGHEYGV